MVLFSGRRIAAPERGLLAMHPFVDVLEGRSLFTATAHDGVLDVTAVVDAPPGEAAASPWSVLPVSADAQGGPPQVDAADGLGTLLAATTPPRIELRPGTAGSAFAGEVTIGDSPATLFGHGLHDRRGRDECPALPSPGQVAAARAAGSPVGGGNSPFSIGRPLTGAMRPYLTMAVEQADELFVA